MATAKPSMVEQVLALHRQHYGGEFAVIVQDEHVVPRLLALLIERRQKQTATRLTIAPVSSTIAPTRSGPVMVRTAKGRKLMFADGSGAFRIDLGHGAVLHAIRCRLHDKIAREYLAGPEKTIRDLYLLLESGRKRARTKLAKRGLWRTFQWDRDVAYARWNIEAETERFQAHPSYAVLLEDARHFFRNIDFFTRHGQSGMRKVLLTGPPGTGKTSILMALATELGRDLAVVLANEDKDVVVTCAKAARQQRPCIVMVEEMDMLVRPSSAALGFLDGTDTPRNPAGTYLIATTNYPRKIDRRVLKRPGRIDRVIAVGALRSRAAAAVASGLLPDDVTLPAVELGKALDRTTPAEIREIVATAIRLCLPEPGQDTAPPLDIAMIERARASLKHMIKTAEQLADDTPEEREDLHGRLGPLDDDIPF
jgi:ATPase family protein associated with various cellular activities (AAA)